jgi:hypothetical protein
MNEHELKQRLARQVLRCRTGVLLADAGHLGKEPDLAARAGMQPLDLTRHLLDIQPGTKYADITAETLSRALDDISKSNGVRDCILVYNLDLPLARLDDTELSRLWKHLRKDLQTRPKTLVFLLPSGAEVIFPEAERKLWDEEKRLARAAW